MRPFGLSKVLGFAVAIATMLSIATSQAEPVQNKAVVRGVRGTANYSTDRGANWKKLGVGTELRQNSIVRTAPGSTVDLFLGDNGPVVRVTEDTQLGIDKLTSENLGNNEKVIETQLDLRSGRILGHVKKLAAASKYEVKTPTGVAGIRGTRYDIRADGTVTVTEGSVMVVYVVGGQTSSVTANAGQTVRPPTTPGGQVTPEPTPTAIANDINSQIIESINIINGGGTGPVTAIIALQPIIAPQEGDPVNNSETVFRSQSSTPAPASGSQNE